MKRGRQNAGMCSRGFTLIELIVVISIIAILASIALMVGSHVMQRGRIELTRNLLRVLDQTQDSYLQDREGKIPYKWTDTSAQKNEYGIVDGRINPMGPNDIVEPSTTFYLLAIQDSTSASSIVKGLDSRFVTRGELNGTTSDSIPTHQGTVAYPQDSAGNRVFGLVIKDAWGNAIRYVHPKFQGGFGAYTVPGGGSGPTRDATFNVSGTFKLRQSGADVPLQFRRSYSPAVGQAGDADEGLCVGSRGYFYSPGIDKDAGTREDNVYLEAKPQFPPETAKF